MTAKQVKRDGVTIKIWDKSFSIDNELVYLKDDPEDFADDLIRAMEKYRKKKNKEVIGEFMKNMGGEVC